MDIGPTEKIHEVELPAREAPATKPAREPLPRHEPAPEKTPEKVPEKVPAGPGKDGEGE